MTEEVNWKTPGTDDELRNVKLSFVMNWAHSPVKSGLEDPCFDRAIEQFDDNLSLAESYQLPDFVAMFPRRFLGNIVYASRTTLDTMQTESLVGLREKDLRRFAEIKEEYLILLNGGGYIPRAVPGIPPLLPEYTNCLIQIKLTQFDLNERFNQALVERRLWGGASQVYTDDSDVAALAVHMGVNQDKADLRRWNPQWTLQHAVRPLNREITDCDLCVTLLLLPPLREYAGHYANGLNSRTWLHRTPHRGLSMTIHSYRWQLPT